MDDERVSATLDVTPVTLAESWTAGLTPDELVLRNFLATLCDAATAGPIAGRLVGRFGDLAGVLRQSDKALKAAAPELRPPLVAALRAIGDTRMGLTGSRGLAA